MPRLVLESWVGETAETVHLNVTALKLMPMKCVQSNTGPSCLIVENHVQLGSSCCHVHKRPAAGSTDMSFKGTKQPARKRLAADGGNDQPASLSLLDDKLDRYASGPSWIRAWEEASPEAQVGRGHNGTL